MKPYKNAGIFQFPVELDLMSHKVMNQKQAWEQVLQNRYIFQQVRILAKKERTKINSIATKGIPTHLHEKDKSI